MPTNTGTTSDWTASRTMGLEAGPMQPLRIECFTVNADWLSSAIFRHVAVVLPISAELTSTVA